MRNSSASKTLAALVILGLMGIVVVGCSSPGGTATGQKANIGQTITIDEMRFRVDGAAKTKEVGPANNLFKVKDGDFVVVDLTVKNEAETADSFDGDMAKLYDDTDTLYEMNLEASSAACRAAGEDYKNVWFGSLEPGATAKTKAVFEIPAEVKGLRCELRSPSIGSENMAVVSLGI